MTGACRTLASCPQAGLDSEGQVGVMSRGEGVRHAFVYDIVSGVCEEQSKALP